MSWLTELRETARSQVSGAVLTFNTADRVFERTPEEPRLASLTWFLASEFDRQGLRVGYFSLARGFMELRPPGQRRSASPLATLAGQDNALAVLRGLDPILRDNTARVVVVLDYVDHLAPQGASSHLPPEQAAAVELLHGWSNDDDIRQSGNFLVLISREGALHPLVTHESGFRHLAVALPDVDERQGFAEYLLTLREQGCADRLGQLDPGFSAAELARASSGLRLCDIETLFQQAAVSGEPISRGSIRERKRETVRQLCHGLLEVVEPGDGLQSVGGCIAAKQYFRSLKPLWLSGHSSIPQGILLAGVPGSGKSFLIKSLARELESPCLALRNVREQWVGASERNMERILQVAESLAPCLFWTDEVDQQVGGERSSGASGDSGVNERLFGRLLEFFGDSRVRGRILWVATTNRPDILDVALRDRFSVKIPFLHPTATERAEVMPMLAEQISRGVDPAIPWADIARLPGLDMLSFRALQEILVWAGTLADMRSGTPNSQIAEQDLLRAAADYKPSFDPAEHTLIALSALQMTSFHSLLPWMGVGASEPVRHEWPAYIEALVDADTGHLDAAKLEQEIHRLREYRRWGTGS
jgi:transitional endoplasmic reticulum ATPase